MSNVKSIGLVLGLAALGVYAGCASTPLEPTQDSKRDFSAGSDAVASDESDAPAPKMSKHKMAESSMASADMAKESSSDDAPMPSPMATPPPAIQNFDRSAGQYSVAKPAPQPQADSWSPPRHRSSDSDDSDALYKRRSMANADQADQYESVDESIARAQRSQPQYSRNEDSPPVRPAPIPLDSVPVIASRQGYSDTTFQHFGVNPTFDTTEQNASTFSVDVDTASYTLARSYLDHGTMPDEAAVRVEEFVNSFDYAYKPPEKDPISIAGEIFPSPNRHGYHVLEIGVKAHEVDEDDRKPLHLVFVVDRSGSMSIDDRIELVRSSLKLLVKHLGERDTVGIVSFSSDARVDLEPTSVFDQARIDRALDSFAPDGNTNVEAGLRLGYRLAEEQLENGGVHRVILLSDGVANTGLTEADAIYDTVRDEAARGITVTTIGVGLSNFNDALLNRFAQLGKGNYFYIDGPAAARHVFVEQLGGTAQPVAKDVKIQVEFDKKTVAGYRLLGYESRTLHKRDFGNDRIDGGEMGVGHSVTAVYEIKLRKADSSFGTVRVRYKDPNGDDSRLVEKDLTPKLVRPSFHDATAPGKLALVAAAFAEKLRGTYWVRNLSYGELEELWRQVGEPLRLRKDVDELGRLIHRAEEIDRRGDRFERDWPVARMDFDRLPVLE